ncbi:MAG: hypothetical protein ABR583_00250 [Gaiellaceae bacterium]
MLLVAATAQAIGPLRDIFEGEPAPPPVKRSISGFNDFHEQLTSNGLGGLVLRAEEATGLIKLRPGNVPALVWTGAARRRRRLHVRPDAG